MDIVLDNGLCNKVELIHPNQNIEHQNRLATRPKGQ